MFYPIKDENPTRRVPYVNYGLIVVNIVAFLHFELRIWSGEEWVIAGFGLVPTRFAADPLGEAFAIVTSMFMHGGWAHLGINMINLNVFGDNLEDALGHFRYLVFYLLCGSAAALLHVGVDMDSPVPMVGASGAIAGVVGAYVLLYPRAPVVTIAFPLLWLVVGVMPIIPAWMVAAMFFVNNVVLALEALGGAGAVAGSVAVFAHLGGFFAGLFLLRPFLGSQRIAERRALASNHPSPSSRPGSRARWRRKRRPKY